ncbi:MAG: putative nucleotide-diphospho-sugar transferase [Paracoccaceae bacterium]
MPDAAIDLFTDAPEFEDPVFDAVHMLERDSRRPKIEALRRARFDRTVCLDNDVIALADVGDIFDSLDRFDIVGVHDNNRNAPNALRMLDTPLPATFPSINSGMLGVRGTPACRDLLAAWDDRMRQTREGTDQPALREVLWHSDLRLGILPIEYNLMSLGLIKRMNHFHGAPRLLHVREITKFGRDIGDPRHPYELGDYFSPGFQRQLKGMLAADATVVNPVAIRPGRPTRRERWLKRLGLPDAAVSVFSDKFQADLARAERAHAIEAAAKERAKAERVAARREREAAKAARQAEKAAQQADKAARATANTPPRAD